MGVGNFLFSASNPNSGIRADLCIVVLERLERILDVGVDFLIVTLLFASATDLTRNLTRDWFHN
jgi:hypothetical protein